MQTTRSTSPEQQDAPPISIESLGYDRQTDKLVLTFGHNLQSNVRVYLDDARINSSHDNLDLPYKHTHRYDLPTKSNTSITFQTSDGRNIPIRFTGQLSKLSTVSSYWLFGSHLVTHDGQSIAIRPRRVIEVLRRELALLASIVFVHRRPQIAAMRILYWLTKLAFRRRTIWLFSDKIYRAGDNAEYVYRHAIQQSPSNNSYHYVLSPSSPDATRFRQQNLPYVRYKSLKQRLLFLNATILVFTHNNAPGFYRFGGENSIYFRDLYNYDTMYIQHGLSIQNMSHLYNKGVDDIKRYFTASPLETKSLLQPQYGYLEHEIIPAGLARYDGLTDIPGRTILIAPTWRKDLSIADHDYDEVSAAIESFTSTTYFNVYNALITDKKLIDYARKNNYSITFLLHPELSNVASAFQSDNNIMTVVSPSSSVSYEQLISRAAVLVTDYSGLQFDAAYLYKPILYYHPTSLPPSYKESIYSYSSDALGTLLTDHESIITALCNGMERSFDLDPVYRDRIDQFFYHHDHSNAERIYNHIIDWQNNSHSLPL